MVIDHVDDRPADIDESAVERLLNRRRSGKLVVAHGIRHGRKTHARGVQARHALVQVEGEQIPLPRVVALQADDEVRHGFIGMG